MLGTLQESPIPKDQLPDLATVADKLQNALTNLKTPPPPSQPDTEPDTEPAPPPPPPTSESGEISLSAIMAEVAKLNNGLNNDLDSQNIAMISQINSMTATAIAGAQDTIQAAQASFYGACAGLAVSVAAAGLSLGMMSSASSAASRAGSEQAD